MSNSIFVISPYKMNGMWVFDDPARGLAQEPFVSAVKQGTEWTGTTQTM